ncbi:hypothetical protein DIPPA_08628 [Diplonema papillatum]|nr:hypothetical protein DIPPA_08628 [Diplonema papillatum]
MEGWVWDVVQQCRDDMENVWKSSLSGASAIGCDVAYMNCCFVECTGLWNDVFQRLPERRKVRPSSGVPEDYYENTQRLCGVLRTRVRKQNDVAYAVLELLKGKVERRKTTLDSVHDTLLREVSVIRDEMFRLRHPDAKVTEFEADDFSVFDFVRFANNNLTDLATYLTEVLKTAALLRPDTTDPVLNPLLFDSKTPPAILTFLDSLRHDWSAAKAADRPAAPRRKSRVSPVFKPLDAPADAADAPAPAAEAPPPAVDRQRHAAEEVADLQQQIETLKQDLARAVRPRASSVVSLPRDGRHSLTGADAFGLPPVFEPMSHVQAHDAYQRISDAAQSAAGSGPDLGRMLDGVRKEIEVLNLQHDIKIQNMILEWQTLLAGSQSEHAKEVEELQCRNRELTIERTKLAAEVESLKGDMARAAYETEVKLREELARKATDTHRVLRALTVEYDALMEKYTIERANARTAVITERRNREEVTGLRKALKQIEAEAKLSQARARDAANQTDDLIPGIPLVESTGTILRDYQDSDASKSESARSSSHENAHLGVSYGDSCASEGLSSPTTRGDISPFAKRRGTTPRQAACADSPGGSLSVDACPQVMGSSGAQTSPEVTFRLQEELEHKKAEIAQLRQRVHGLQQLLPRANRESGVDTDSGQHTTSPSQSVHPRGREPTGSAPSIFGFHSFKGLVSLEYSFPNSFNNVGRSKSPSDAHTDLLWNDSFVVAAADGETQTPFDSAADCVSLLENLPEVRREGCSAPFRPAGAVARAVPVDEGGYALWFLDYRYGYERRVPAGKVRKLDAGEAMAAEKEAYRKNVRLLEGEVHHARAAVAHLLQHGSFEQDHRSDDMRASISFLERQGKSSEVRIAAIMADVLTNPPLVACLRSESLFVDLESVTRRLAVVQYEASRDAIERYLLIEHAASSQHASHRALSLAVSGQNEAIRRAEQSEESCRKTRVVLRNWQDRVKRARLRDFTFAGDADGLAAEAEADGVGFDTEHRATQTDEPWPEKVRRPSFVDEGSPGSAAAAPAFAPPILRSPRQYLSPKAPAKTAGKASPRPNLAAVVGGVKAAKRFGAAPPLVFNSTAAAFASDASAGAESPRTPSPPLSSRLCELATPKSVVVPSASPTEIGPDTRVSSPLRDMASAFKTNPDRWTLEDVLSSYGGDAFSSAGAWKPPPVVPELAIDSASVVLTSVTSKASRSATRPREQAARPGHRVSVQARNARAEKVHRLDAPDGPPTPQASSKQLMLAVSCKGSAAGVAPRALPPSLAHFITRRKKAAGKQPSAREATETGGDGWQETVVQEVVPASDGVAAAVETLTITNVAANRQRTSRQSA